MRGAATVTFVVALVALVTLTAASGAGAQPRAEPGMPRSRAGRVVARRSPSLSDLPSPGALTTRSAELVAAWQLADQALRLRVPRSSAQSLAATNRWARERFAPWIRRKTDAIRAATDALTRLAARGGEQVVVATAVMGLLQEDLGGAVAQVAPPAVIADDIQLFDAFMDALEDQARGVLERAREAYERCAQSQGPAGTVGDAYRAACTTRLGVVNATLAEMNERAQARDREVAAAQARPRAEPAPPAPAGAGVLGVLREEPAR